VVSDGEKGFDNKFCDSVCVRRTLLNHDFRCDSDGVYRNVYL